MIIGHFRATVASDYLLFGNWEIRNEIRSPVTYSHSAFHFRAGAPPNRC